MAYTKTEIKKIAIDAPLTGFISTPGTLSAADSVKSAIQKLDANQADLDIPAISQKILSIAGNYSQSII